MSQPTFWPKNQYWYPIGNTPPICLTDYLPGQEDANILLLGCGDPRNILYTVFIDHADSPRLLDITCCDCEPAIIARNVLLLTLIADNVETGHILLCWRIFYDLFIDKQTAVLLKEHCIKLANFASDITTWTTSPYGDFIKFANQDTLHKARRSWSSYAETLILPDSQQTQLKQRFLSDMKAKSNPRTSLSTIPPVAFASIPSAAPLCAEYVRLAPQAFTQYWKLGVTNPKVTSTTPIQVNPTFLFSTAGRQFNLHSGTDPCAAFHLALALTQISFDDSPTSKPAKTERDLWNACRKQFSQWAASFHRRVKRAGEETPMTIIRFAVGEALAFCDALQLCKAGDFSPMVYSSTWGGTKFSFDGQTIPIAFNVIDTSNLSDTVGLLNVLVAATPLLQKMPYSVLNTSSLLSYNDHPTRRSAIEERAILDFPSLALLLGITPTCFNSGLAFRNCSETASFSASAGFSPDTHHYERVTWKFSEYTHAKWDGTAVQRNHKVQYAAEDFVEKLFATYLKMFSDESASFLLSLRDARNHWKAKQKVHYSRQSFVRFLQAIRSIGIIETNWTQTLDIFATRLRTDATLPNGASYAQNLFADLHIWGIYSVDLLRPGAVARVAGSKPAPFQTWENIPPVVCLVLKVPRKELKALETETRLTGEPTIECETFYQSSSGHSSIRPVFGDISDVGGRKIITEDPRGFSGESPLIISFFVSSWILVKQPHELRVGLRAKATPEAVLCFAQKLGPELRVYSTNLLNRNNVFILRERPDNPGELQRRARMNPVTQHVEGLVGLTKASHTSGHSEILSKKLEVGDPGAKNALANKAIVSIKQTTPFCMEVAIGDCHRYSLLYPIPVDGSHSKTRIARKSSYIEVDVPPRVSPLSQLMLQPFPVTLANKDARHQIICWNAPYINLDYLPTISFSENPIWVDRHLRFCMTRQERLLQHSESRSPEKWGPSTNFKVSIKNILRRFAMGKHKAYFLYQDGNQIPHAVILALSVRHDTSSATILGDAVVIFPDSTNLQLIGERLEGNNMITSIHGDEVRLWSRALPVFAERCRRWEHLPTCEYIQRECVPLSVEYGQSPLCSCGKGKNLGSFHANNAWKDLGPHATRIALTPMFPVPYLEDVTEPAMKDLGEKQPISTPSNPPPAAAKPKRKKSRNVCQHCQGTGNPKLRICCGCRAVRYCSRDCQKADWKHHKNLCKKPE